MHYTVLSWPAENVILSNSDITAHRPSKCPEFYTNKILGEQSLRQKVCQFCQNLNRAKIMYLTKYTVTV